MKRIPLGVLIILVVASAVTLCRSRFGVATQDRENIAAASSPQHLTGTDELGRDRTVRLACALLLSLTGATLASSLATVIAATVGILAAFAHRSLGSSLLYLSDLFLTLPWLFLLMILRSALPLNMPPVESAAVTFLLLALLAWPVYARIIYASALSIRNSEWLIHARAAGLRSGQLLLHHIVPRLLPQVVSQFVILIPVCIVAEANLGALGLGVGEPMASWGSMLLELQHPAALMGSQWVLLPIALLITVLLLVELIVEVNNAHS